MVRVTVLAGLLVLTCFVATDALNVDEVTSFLGGLTTQFIQLTKHISANFPQVPCKESLDIYSSMDENGEATNALLTITIDPHKCKKLSTAYPDGKTPQYCVVQFFPELECESHFMTSLCTDVEDM